MLLILGAYLLGAIPFGLLIGLARGVDVRQHGSRNIGATNVGRVVGRPWGYTCLALDLGKGLAPTLFAGLVLVREPVDSASLVCWLGTGFAAVLGHVFPVYLRFRGGKGVATTIGVALGIYPYFTVPMAAGLLAYLLARFATGAVSVGSLALALVFPAAVYGYLRYRQMELADAWPLLAVALLLALLIIVRHRENIARLWRGEEMSAKSPAGSDGDAR